MRTRIKKEERPAPAVDATSGLPVSAVSSFSASTASGPATAVSTGGTPIRPHGGGWSIANVSVHSPSPAPSTDGLSAGQQLIANELRRR